MRDFPERFRRLLLLVLVAAAPGAIAQYPPQEGYPPAYDAPVGPRLFDLSVFAGYQTNGDASANGGNLDIGDAPVFGAALDWRLHSLAAVELMWEYNNPDASFYSFNPIYPSSSRPFSIPSHFFQLGGMTMRPMGRVEPFIGLTLGAVLFLPESISLTTGGTRTVSDTWRFASTLMLGTKVWMTPNVGLRLEVRMLVPIVFNSGGFYGGTGGSGMYVSAGVPSIQFAFSGGICFGK